MTIQAVYAGGVLRLKAPLPGVAENQEVELTIQTLPAEHPLADLAGTLSDADADEMLR